MARIGGNPRSNVVQLPFEEEGAGKDITVDLGPRRSAPSFKVINGQLAEDQDNTTPFAGPHDDAGDEHNANLAEQLDEEYLNRLGLDVVELVQQDIDDRAPWRSRYERGMEMMGIVEGDIDDGPFPGASNAVHPLILDAVTQFWGRAVAEFVPPEGPAKSKNNGKQSEEMVQRGSRVAEFMNYDMMHQDAGYVSEMSRLLWALPWAGSAFKKTFLDPVSGQVTGIYVPAEDMILHASSADLRTTPRFTHRMRRRLNEIRALQLATYYRDVELMVPSDEDEDEIDAVNDDIGGVESSSSTQDDRDNRLTIYETLIELDLPGYEHTDAQGEPTGLELPYYVTVEKDMGTVLSIRRGWRKDDATYRRRLFFRKYDFVPGPGPYGLGFFHLIGGLQAAATGALRAMLDGAASASLSGGFVSKMANLKGERLIFEPGVWQPVDATGEDLAKAFVSPPFKEPSAALFQMLGFVTDLGRRTASTTEIMSGEGDGKNTPVGTTLALLEQGQKVMSTIHRLFHAEYARELKDRYDLLAEDPPEGGYPYEIGGDEQAVYAEDFAPGVDIVPVSDPNIFSSVQRIQLNQAVVEVAINNPDVVNKKIAIRRFFEALKVPDVDELIPEDPEAMPYDAVGEMQAVLMGKPVKVLPEQDHVAHLKNIAAFASNPEFGGNKDVMAQIGPQLLTITGQHMAYAWATHNRGLGVPAGYMNPENAQIEQSQVPPEQITMLVAQIVPALAQVPGLPAVNEEGEGKDGAALEQAKVEGEKQKLQLKNEEHQMKMQHEQQKMAWEQEREKMKLELEQVKAQAKMQIEQQKAQMQQVQMQQKAQMDQQMMQQEAAMQQQQMAQQSEMDQQRMAQESQMMQREGQMKEAQMGQEMQHAERKSRLDELRSSGPGAGPGGNENG